MNRGFNVRERFVVLGTLLISGPLIQAAPPPPQKMIAWVQAKDSQVGSEIEARLRDVLAERRVDARSYSKLFPADASLAPDAMLTQMRADGIETFLSLRARSAVHWSSPSGNESAGASTLTDFLKKNVRGAKSAADPIAVEPVAEPIEPMTPGPVQGGQPMPGSSAQGTWEILKGEAVLFDVATGKIRWKGKFTVKTAKGLPTERYFQKIAEGVRDTLSQANVISATGY